MKNIPVSDKARYVAGIATAMNSFIFSPLAEVAIASSTLGNEQVLNLLPDGSFKLIPAEFILSNLVSRIERGITLTIPGLDEKDIVYNNVLYSNFDNAIQSIKDEFHSIIVGLAADDTEESK